jgi:uncharacterized membrane protein SpoIIM required for sporulation
MNAPPASSPIDRFVETRRARWERLSSLLERADGGKTRRRTPLSVEELDDMLQLYRLATTDLALARREFPGDRVTLLLNQIVGRAYGYIYRDAPSPIRQLRVFYSRALPAEYRAAWPFLAAAAGLLFVPWIAATVAILLAPATAALMLPPGILSEIQSGHTWFASPGAKHPALASFIMTNNMEVSLLALGGGMFGGLGTVYVLVSNGISLGAVTGALVVYHLADQLLGFVGPHSILELSVVVVAGASGLMLGHAMIWPGLRPRGEAVADAARRSIRLLLGLFPCLVVAGLLEGFVSPASFAWPLKLGIGLVTGIALYSYLLLAGRRSTVSPDL